MIYLTWGIGYTGVFESQVVGVVKNYANLTDRKILLVSLVPYTVFFSARVKIKQAYSKSLILPMIPSRNHWYKYYALLLGLICIFAGEKRLIARGSIACNIALQLRKLRVLKWVCFDGRGAEKAEFDEYFIGQGTKIEKLIPILERNAVKASDFRLAVSTKLVAYWKTKYGYMGDTHVVIPCTVNEENIVPYESNIKNKRKDYGFDYDDIIVAFSGGADLWQSFNELDELACNLIENNSNIRLLFLSDADLTNSEFYNRYPDKIKQMWLKHDEVIQVLNLCDYGVLYRHDSITNYVSSPTKFAEYLAAGLQVLISENIGDYSNMVRSKNLGYVLDSVIKPIYLTANDRHNEIQHFALNNLTKDAFKAEYLRILEYTN